MPLSKTSKRRVKLSKVNIRAKKKITRRENGEGRSTLRGRLKNRQTLALDIVVALHKICPIASPLFFSPKLPPPSFYFFSSSLCSADPSSPLFSSFRPNPPKHVCSKLPHSISHGDGHSPLLLLFIHKWHIQIDFLCL